MPVLIVRLRREDVKRFGGSWKRRCEYYKENGLFVDLKFAIARRLNKNPKYCWANLVCWALRWTPWWSILFPDSNEHDQTHLNCTESGGGAWCGKCFKNGRLSK